MQSWEFMSLAWGHRITSFSGDFIGTERCRNRGRAQRQSTAWTSSPVRLPTRWQDDRRSTRRHLREHVHGVVLAFSGTSGNVVEGDYIGTESPGPGRCRTASLAFILSTGRPATRWAAPRPVQSTSSRAMPRRGCFHFSGDVGQRRGRRPRRDRALPAPRHRQRARRFESPRRGDSEHRGGTTAGPATSSPAMRATAWRSVSGTESNVVEGAYIGTDLTGTMALGNAEDGVAIYGGATRNTVGGRPLGPAISSPATRAWVSTSPAQARRSNVVEGDFIGTGVLRHGGGSQRHQRSWILSPGQCRTRWAVRPPAARDLISGNTFNGVVLAFAGTSYNIVEGTISARG